MRKNFTHFLTLIFIVLAVIFTPATATVGSILTTMADTTTTYQHAAPAQSAIVFSKESLGTYNLANWDHNDLSQYTVSSQISKANIDDFSIQHPDALVMPHNAIGNYTALLMTNNTPNARVYGSYTSPEISLPANGYYRIAVLYYVIGENSSFYLNDYEISLAERGAWRQSSFYVKTDRLTSATMTAKLCLGGSATQKYVFGAVYYANFQVDAIREQEYTREVAALANDERQIDLTNTTDVKMLHTFTENNFQALTPEAGAQSLTNVNPHSVPSLLNFADHPTFYNQDGSAKEMLLLAANNTYAGINVLNNNGTNFEFKPTAHAVYMIQFYSLTGANTTGLYLRVGETYHAIDAISYAYHNAWQLNTIFYVGGNGNQTFTLGFCLGYADNNATGWACLSDLTIYQVSGSYATANAEALGVHDTYDLNATDAVPSVTNGYFDLGTASALSSATYPYPLTASGEWTTDGADNGIVNTAYWTINNVTNPGQNKPYSLNNNIYMLRNLTRTANTLTSPELTTAIDDTTYFSFDAYAAASAHAQAQLTVDDIVLGTIDLDDGAWHRYEFAIIESAYAAARTYRLQFILADIGVAFIDNVRSGNTPDAISNGAKTSITIDLANPTLIKDIWQADQSACYVNPDLNGMMFQNIGQQTTTITNNFAYQIKTETYYRLSITARGENAFVSLSDFTEDLAINDDATYTLYFYLNADSEVTETKLKVLLGSTEKNVYQDANLYLTKVTLETVEDADYDYAATRQETDDKVLVLTPSDASDTTDDTPIPEDNNFFGENWWFLIPGLITAIAILLAVFSFLFRRLKFNKHVTNKTTSYARDVKIKQTKKKIVAEKSAKVDNIIDEPQNN